MGLTGRTTSTASPSLKSLVEELTKSLVDRSDEVTVREIGGANTLVYEVVVAKSDIGKIIGRNGRTLSALRTLVSAVATKLGRKAILEIVE